jgi:nucleoside 2-deoxyribosyltransferase
MSSFWYLATPYSKYPDGIEAAYELAIKAASLLLDNGVDVYSPIVHTHPLSTTGGLGPRNHEFWLRADTPFMDAARGIIVLEADGWRNSFGVAYELGRFRGKDKPVVWMKPGVVPKQSIAVYENRGVF